MIVDDEGNDNSVQLTSARRVVSFKSTVRCVETMHFNDYSIEEIKACYYSEIEYQQIRNDIRRTVRTIGEVGTLNEEQFGTVCSSTTTSRGIEHLVSRTRYDLKRENRERVYRVVLNEQFEQRLELEADESMAFGALSSSGCHRYEMEYDHDMIAAVCRNATRRSVAAAHKVGLQDALVAADPTTANVFSSIAQEQPYKTCRRVSHTAVAKPKPKPVSPQVCIQPQQPQRYLNRAA